IFGRGQDIQQRIPVQRVEVGEHRQASDELRDQPKILQVLRRDVFIQVIDVDLFLVGIHLVPYGLGTQALGNAFLDTVKSPSAYEKYIVRVHRDHFLVGMLAPALRRYVYHGTLQRSEEHTSELQSRENL